MCYEASNKDYEQTITALSDMTSQKEVEEKDNEIPKQIIEEEEKYKNEMIFRFSKLGLNSGSRTFVPGKGRVEGQKEKEEKPIESNKKTEKEETIEKSKEESKEDLEEEFRDDGKLEPKRILNEIGATRTHNPFMDAFNNFSYREPSEEELKESKRIADSYMELQEKEEKEWFVEQEQQLLQQLIDDCQLEEYLGGKEKDLKCNIEGVLDDETLKVIYDTSDSSLNTSQTSASTVEDTKQETIIITTKKNKGRRNKKKKTPEKKIPPDVPFDNEKPYNENNSMTPFYTLNPIVAEEAVDFANDASLQYLINEQILADLEARKYSDYQYDKNEFPSLVKGDSLKQINRKKAFAVNDWTKVKSGNNAQGSGDHLEEEQIQKIKMVFPAMNVDI